MDMYSVHTYREAKCLLSQTQPQIVFSGNGGMPRRGARCRNNKVVFQEVRANGPGVLRVGSESSKPLRRGQFGAIARG
jgi:hypothetical protein